MSIRLSFPDYRVKLLVVEDEATNPFPPLSPKEWYTVVCNSGGFSVIVRFFFFLFVVEVFLLLSGLFFPFCLLFFGAGGGGGGVSLIL